MPWLRLDDQFSDHPKIVEAGPLAGWLHVCGMLYCSRLLTDGFIPAGQVRKLADVDNATELADRLVTVGLWDRADGGYQVHDYLDYNPSRAKVLAEREANAARQASYRERHASISNGVTNTVTEPVSNDPPVPTPTPVPQPVPKPKKNTGAHAPAAVADVSSVPFAYLVAFCEEAGQDITQATARWKSEHCANTEALIVAGCSESEFRRLCRYALSQSWRTKQVTPNTLRGMYDDWVMEGRPERELPKRGSPTNGVRRGVRAPDNSGIDHVTDIWKEAMR